ncbi:MAG: radical SAM protein [Candidatus Auribacter fodinae]|jgi:radical SAM superfamily enzyme YgiQ (UPF0313 family)|uniref:Radical SAM protein n=1 Tax=Candidatus Auribacter fodinae TaxID=2093366 RepID=A0A3A4QY83_9BACT|nr:MAG: radical SAM protein [Candidatus Auribacter fodinae]
MLSAEKKRSLFRMVIPLYPSSTIYSFVSNKMTSLGAVCIASTVNDIAFWDAEVIDENNLRLFGPRSIHGGADHEFLQKQRPADIVGLYGGLTSTIPRLYKIAQFYKKQGVITVAGGQHFADDTIDEAFSNGIDYIVVGEGEDAIKEIIGALQGNGCIDDIKGIVYKKNDRIIRTPIRPPSTDFDARPIPDFALVRYAKIDIYPVERIRGCGMDCEFCTVKGKPRYASPERALEIISSIVETRKGKSFFIVDDLFGQQRDETIRFCRMLEDYQKRIGRGLSFTAQMRLDKAYDTELLTSMQKAGINKVAIGFESPIEEDLKIMKKKLKIQDIVMLSRALHKKGFFVHGMFIFGYPLRQYESLTTSLSERIRRYKKFIKEAKIDTVQILLPIPLPGTELRQRLMQNGRVYPKCDIGWEYYDGTFPLFEPDPPLTAEDMHQAARKIMGSFYQFKYMFMIGLNVISFISIIAYLHNIKLGWSKWYRYWRNDLIRFGGWITIRKWTHAFRKDMFLQKIQIARQHLNGKS